MIIGFIGLGEVGSRYASGMAKDGAIVYGYDIRFGLSEFAKNEEYCRKSGVKLVGGIKEVIEESNILLATSTCSKAIECSIEAAKYLKRGQIYVEFNSAIPTIKEKCQKIVEVTGADFVDACTMDNPKLYHHHNPCVMSGPKAKDVIDVLKAYGMDHITLVGNKVGAASGLKCVRSICMKGIEAVLIEMMCAARKVGVLDEVIDSTVKSLEDDLRFQLTSMVTSNIVHTGRRSDEIELILQMLMDLNLNSIMTSATLKKLRWSRDLGLTEKFKSEEPENIHMAIDAFLEASDN